MSTKVENGAEINAAGKAFGFGPRYVEPREIIGQVAASEAWTAQGNVDTFGFAPILNFNGHGYEFRTASQDDQQGFYRLIENEGEDLTGLNAGLNVDRQGNIYPTR